MLVKIVDIWINPDKIARLECKEGNINSTHIFFTGDRVCRFISIPIDEAAKTINKALIKHWRKILKPLKNEDKEHGKGNS